MEWMGDTLQIARGPFRGELPSILPVSAARRTQPGRVQFIEPAIETERGHET